MPSCILCRESSELEPRVAFWKDGFEVVRCPSCGLLFRASLPSSEELIAVYGGDYFRDDPLHPNREGYADYFEDAPLHRRNARRRLEMLESLYGGAGKRLLDVGCAAGFFVAEAQARGWRAEGIDLSREVVEWGRRCVVDELRDAPFARFSGPLESYDMVTMWDYIEHSVDPVADITHASGLLVPGGLLALSTGDVESLAARLIGRRWHLLTPRHHNFFFGIGTLRRLLGAAGFTVVSVRRETSWYSLSHLVYKLTTPLPERFGRVIAHRVRRSRVRDVAIPVNLLDIVTVVAAKGSRELG